MTILKAVLFVLLFSTACLHAEECVILETTSGGETRVVAGNAALASKKTTPMSTFKIVLAWMGLELKQVDPGTLHHCTDKHVPGTPRDLTLREAMYFSSNDYFVWLGGKIGKPQ